MQTQWRNGNKRWNTQKPSAEEQQPERNIKFWFPCFTKDNLAKPRVWKLYLRPPEEGQIHVLTAVRPAEMPQGRRRPYLSWVADIDKFLGTIESWQKSYTPDPLVLPLPSFPLSDFTAWSHDHWSHFPNCCRSVVGWPVWSILPCLCVSKPFFLPQAGGGVRGRKGL